MNHLVKYVGIAAVAMAFTATVTAAPLIGLSIEGQTTTSVAGATIIDFNSGCGYAICSGDYDIVTGSASGYYAQPAGISSAYLIVPKPSVTLQTADFNLGTTANYFGLFWGSIDDYNTISFYRDNVEIANFSGTDVVGQAAKGDQVSYASNRYINFDFGNDVYDAVRLTSTGFAFESANHAYKSTFVPEPINLVLMSLGVFGLFAARRLQRSR